MGLPEDFPTPPRDDAPDPVPLDWLRIALANLFDVEFLRNHIRRGRMEARFANGPAAQDALLAAIKQLKPRDDVPLRATAWRTYNVLQLRYVKGLSQAETALQLNLGVRQLRREQARAVRAITELLAESGPSQPDPAPASSGNQFASQPELIAQELVRPEELLQAVLYLLDGVIQRRDLHVQVSIHPPLPALRCNPMIARQLFISAIEWLLRQMRSVKLLIDMSLEAGALSLAMQGPTDGSDWSNHLSGLATVHDLAQLAGGTVDITANPPSVGMTLRLPASKRPYVLVVDDNINAVQLVMRFLRSNAEFEAVAATDADEALRQITTLQPACVLLDVMMPHRDGWEILTLLKTHPQTAAIPVVISSVLQQEDLARALGADAMLPKPFNEAQLLAVLRRVTQSSRPAASATAV